MALPGAGDVQFTHQAYMRTVEVGPHDLVVIATSHVAAPATWWNWPGARRLVRSGPDGADLALLAAIENERLAERCGHIVIGSGDGIFAESAARLQSAGCRLTVVSRAESLSRALRLAVRDIRLLETTLDLPAVVVPRHLLQRAA